MPTPVLDDRVPNEVSDLDALERSRLLFKNRNYKEALSIYLQLTESVGSEVFLRLGWMYEFGMGTEKEPEKAEYWYKKAAEAGIAAGYYCLAAMRFRAGQADEVKALMEEAAVGGYAPALFHLGQMYRFGKGVAVDAVRGYEYYAKAAELGHIFARRAIAQRIIRGDAGIWRVPIGLLKIAKIMWDGVRIYLEDPSDDRLRRLA